ncbi:MAG: hypothetical protein EWM72_02764 [Nitrospira sp.]|nr:MAG: hypothetical protein EWM72_02764 [Nitrospira sp.]
MAILPVSDALTIRTEGSRVLLLHNGALITSMPWQAAIEIAKALAGAARLAQEMDDAQRIIADQAIVRRLGLPIGLTNNPRLQAEALKEAQWGDIRRYIPSISVASGEAIGTPALIQDRRKGDHHGKPNHQ